jgi:hypothetical protein
MSSRGKKKTTFAKLNRETKLRERRVEKQARKEARRLAPPEPADASESERALTMQAARGES